MIKYDFAPITARPFPTLLDVRNPWIISKSVKHIINVSTKEDPEIKAAIAARGISYTWLPTEEKPMNMPNIFKAVRLLREYDAAGEHTVIHCIGGNNRSRTVVEAYYFAKTRTHLNDEYMGYQNHLIYNCKAGYLPALEQMEHYLTLL